MNLSIPPIFAGSSIATWSRHAALGLSAVLVSACQAALPPLAPLGSMSAPLVHPPSSALDSPYQGAKGCTGRRWVSVVKPGSPDPPSSWGATRLFQSSSARASAPVPARLSKYRLYKWKGQKPPTRNDVEELKRRFHPAHLAEDCMIAGPFSGAEGLLDAVHTSQLDWFRAWTGLSLSLSPGSAKIHIAVPDTSPDSLPGGPIPMGASKHGYTMAWIAREQACIQSECNKVEVSTVLAMPQVSNEEESSGGGYFGTPLQLAEAITRSVDQWIPNIASEPHLVINLSLGWQPGVEGGDPSEPPAQAVLDALRYAYCQGALVVAAAGNHPGGRDVNKGQTYPAAWENATLPTAQECQPPLGSNDRLVFAVGGINHARGPIFVTRPGSLSRFVAPAVLGIAGPSDALPPAITGTSVAAAVVSGVAAAVWSYRPELTASQVMDWLSETARTVNVSDPTLLLDPNQPHQVKEVNRCLALSTVSPGLTCDPPPPLFTGTEDPGLEATIQAIFSGFQYYPGYLVPELAPFPELQQVQLEGLSALPSIRPQPGQVGCGSACRLSPSSNTLHVYIDPSSISGLTLKDMTLTVKLLNGNVVLRRPAQEIALSPGDAANFTGLNLTEGSIAEAALSWTVMEGLTQLGSLQETIQVQN